MTPSLNQAAYLPANLASVASQAGPFQVEHVVMDGGSTDGSAGIIAAHAQAARRTDVISDNMGVRVVWTSEPDRGQSHAINKGLTLATGDIVTYLNSDDCLLPGALETVRRAFLMRSEAAWLYGWCRTVDGDERVTGRLVGTYKKLLGWRFDQRRLILANYIAQPATFWRRSAFQQAGFFDESLDYTMDLDYWLRLAGLGPALVVHRELAVFRWHAESKSTLRRAAMFAEARAVASRYSDDRLLLAGASLHGRLTVAAYELGERLRRIGPRRAA